MATTNVTAYTRADGTPISGHERRYTPVERRHLRAILPVKSSGPALRATVACALTNAAKYLQLLRGKQFGKHGSSSLAMASELQTRFRARGDNERAVKDVLKEAGCHFIAHEQSGRGGHTYYYAAPGDHKRIPECAQRLVYSYPHWSPLGPREDRHAQPAQPEPYTPGARCEAERDELLASTYRR